MGKRIPICRIAIAAALMAAGGRLAAQGASALPAVALTPVPMSEAQAAAASAPVAASPVEQTNFRVAKLDAPVVAPTLPSFAPVSASSPVPHQSNKVSAQSPASVSSPAWRWFGYGAANPFPANTTIAVTYGADFPPVNVPVPADPNLPTAKQEAPTKPPTSAPPTIAPPVAVPPKVELSNEPPAAMVAPTLDLPKPVAPAVADTSPPLPTAAPALDLKLNVPPPPKPTPVVPANDPWTSVPGAKNTPMTAEVAASVWKPSVVRASGASFDTPRSH